MGFISWYENLPWYRKAHLKIDMFLWLNYGNFLRGMKRFIVRKYVMAKSAAQALRQEKNISPDDVWLDEKWIDEQTRQNKEIVGFKR